MTAPRVLVVDDSSTIRRVVGNVLQGAGYGVATADSGEAGLGEARALMPDLILLDFMMPGMNGYQFIKALDEDDDLGAIPVVLMCTRSDQLPESALKQMGVVDTITKPFSPEAILAVVSYSLEKHGLRKREETTRVTDLLDVPTDAGAPPIVETEPPVDPAAEEVARGALLADLTRLLADALAARGIDEADGLARSITGQVRDTLSSAMLTEFVKRELGVDTLRRPLPSLYGDLSAVPLPEVLQLLKFQGQTGLLELALDEGPHPARMEIAFKNGFIVAVRARNLRGDLLLGRYFVSRGLVSPERLEAMLAEGGEGAPIGQRLLDAGLITAEQLRAALGEQAQDLMYELLRARRGVFGLRKGDGLLPKPHVVPGFSVDGLLFEGLRRIDEWSVIEKEIPSFGARFARIEGADARGLTSEEAEVLGLFPAEGTLSVNDCVARSRHRAFDVCQLLFRLVVLKRLARVTDGREALVIEDGEAAPDARAKAAGGAR